MIESYRKLWPKRSATDRINTQEDLEKHILIELNDELTHPRVRKSIQQKLEIALLRISESDLSESEKTNLASLYKKIAAQ